MTSITDLGWRDVTVAGFANVMRESFARVFGYDSISLRTPNEFRIESLAIQTQAQEG
jgi:lipoate-protein ligase A